jgi:spore germination protein GerM
MTRKAWDGVRPARGGLVVALVLALGLAACGLPTDRRYAPVANGDIPADLSATTTTTTTSPTTTTIAPAPTTTVPPSTTTTTPNEAVTLYFILNNKLVPVQRDLPKPLSVDAVLGALSQGALGRDRPGYVGLRSSLPPTAVRGVKVTGGVATVDLDPTFFEQVTSATEQINAFGQVVLTLTDRPGIGQVKFTTAGTPQAIVRANGEALPADTAISRDDYASLIAPG